eukprot:134035-Pelagomonas_calceolata.AAC.1
MAQTMITIAIATVIGVRMCVCLCACACRCAGPPCLPVRIAKGLKTPFHRSFHPTFTMPSKTGHTPPKRKWPLPWTITLIIYTTGALTP